MNLLPKPKVYVTQEVRTANYGPAEQFGEVVFLTASELSQFKNSVHNKKVIAVLRENLKNFNKEIDFIAPSGSPVITGLVFAILREKTTHFQVLKWNARDQMYAPLFISIEENELVH